MRRLCVTTLATVGLCAGLSACAPTQPLVQVPTLEVQQVRLTGLTLPAGSVLGGVIPGGLLGGPVGVPTAQLSLDMRVTNPNPFPLNLARIGADLIIDGANVGRVDLPDIALPARGSTAQAAYVAVPVTPGTAAGFLKVARGQLVTYRLDGAFTINMGPLGAQTFGPFTLSQGQWKQPPILPF